MKNPTKPRAGTPTDLNIFTLANLFGWGQTHGVRNIYGRAAPGTKKTSVANALESTEASGIRRCMKAGLVVPSVAVRASGYGRTCPATLDLTTLGIAVLTAYVAAGYQLTASAAAVLSDASAPALEAEAA